MNRNSKKGFTIVELIIVIAVIAVLAAVLIPTFSNLIQKANEAKDTALVSNLNKAVAMDNGSKETVYDVLKVAEDIAGINVAKINAAANSNEILWDSTNKCFVYSVNGEIKYIPDSKTKDVAGDYDYWKLSDKKADVEAGVYSIYWTGAALSEITATTGFDAGEAEIGKIIYQREDNATAQTVTIRTNGGELEVSAKPDTVYHYDVASKVVVTKVHNASYHENGTVVGNLEVKEGHVELGAKADVSTVIVAPTTANAAKVTVTTGATVGVVAATTDAGKTYLDSATTVPSDKKAETKLDESVLRQFAGGVGTEASPYLISTNEHFANIIQGTASNKVYYKLISDVDVSTNFNIEDRNCVADRLTYAVFDGAGNTIKITENSHLFFYAEYSEIKDLEVVVSSSMVANATYTTFNNVDVSGTISTSGRNKGVYVIYARIVHDSLANIDKSSLTYVDCDCSVDFTSDGTGYNAVFTGYAFPEYNGMTRETSLTYQNCTYSGKFVSGKAAMFLGNNSANKGKVSITIENCKNNGIIQATTTDPSYSWNSYVATGIANKANDQSFINNSVYLNGTKLTADNIAEPMGIGFIQGPNDANLKLAQNKDGTFNVTASENTNVAYYVVSVGIYSIWNEGGTLVQSVEEKILPTTFANGVAKTTLKNLAFVDAAWVTANSSATSQNYGEGEYAYTIYTLNGTEYYYLPDNTNANLDGKSKAAQIIGVSCYDADGNLIASASLSK